MMTIQKPKRIWQKKKDYNKKKLIRKIQRRNKTSFDDGKDGSYQDWKTKASKYKHIDIDHDNTFDYEGFYNSDPDNAYRFLNDDPTAHFDDTYKTVYHPTFSDLSIYSGKVDPRFNPKGLKGGHWVNEHKYISPKETPVSMDDRINYIIDAENNGVQLRTYDDQPIWLDDGTRWDGVLPQVIVKPDYQRGKDKGNNKQNWFTRMAIGAAFNENPAVMTAAGWHKDSRGNWKQKRTAATNKLADNLETISMMADGTGSIDLIKSAGKLLWNAIRHPVRTVKQVKTLGNVAKNVAIRGKKYTVATIDKSIKGNETLHKITKPIVAKKRTLKLQDTIDRKISDFKMPKTTKSQKPINQIQGFKSELDWSPESWFGTRVGGQYDAEDVAALKLHLPEYLEIERKAKADGTWLKMDDGTTYQGDPRSWVQLMSNDGKKLSRQRLFHGDSDMFMDIDGKDVTPEKIGNTILWTNTNKHLPHTYGNHHYELAIPKGVANKTFDAKGRNWNDLTDISGYKYKNTNDVFDDLSKDNNIVTINNVVDVGPDSRWTPGNNGIPNILDREQLYDYYKRVFKGDDVALGKDVPRKSLLGNNGNFDLSNKNIYKSLFPLLIGTELLQDNHNSGKDIYIKKANRGKFTEAANEHNMGVQEFARHVLSAPKGKYSSTLRKRANFARNFAH